MYDAAVRKVRTSTVFSHLSLRGLPERIGLRYLLLAAEGLGYAAAGVYIARLIGLRESGVFSIFLASAALQNRFEQLLDENRERIWQKTSTSFRTNALTAGSVFSIFLGMMLAYVGAAVLLKDAEVGPAFHFALQAAGLGSDTILTRKFTGMLGLLGHNFLVMISILMLAFIYRSYGALLALGWNACIWGLVLTFLVRRGLHATDGGSAAFIAGSVVAVLPHLALEASGYVLGSLAAIFFSKGFLKYELKDRRFFAVLRACAWIIIVSSALLALGALLESRWAPWMLARLR
jgi:hypothetical protein